MDCPHENVSFIIGLTLEEGFCFLNDGTCSKSPKCLQPKQPIQVNSEPGEKARLWRLFPFSRDAIC